MWRHLILVPVYLLATALPLLSPVGANLEYEYALLCAYAALILIPLAGLATPNKLLPVDESGAYRPRAAFDLFWMLLFSPAIAMLPGIVMFFWGSCPCSRAGWLFWMAVVTYPAWVLAHALHKGILRARVRGASRLFTGLCFALIVLVAAGSVGAELWFNPQKRIVDMFAGFIHGPIYDDWIAFDLGLMLMRGSHLAIAIGFALLACVTKKSRISVMGTVLAFAAAVGLGLAATNFHSVKNQKKDLDELMFASLPGDGFTLRYRPAPKRDTEDPATMAPEATGKAAKDAAETGVPLNIQRLHRDAQFHIDELRQKLGGKDPQELRQKLGGKDLPHVEIYVYPSDDRKKLWFGGGATDVTDVHTPTVHITGDSWPHPTLRHELVHALASGVAFHGLGFHPNMAFTEGLAVALAPSGSTLSIDDGAASLITSGRLPDVEALFSPAFWKVSGSRAYTVAGSFLRHLIETKGIDGVLALYAGKSWEEAFKQDKATLIKEWKDKILAGYDKDKNALFTEALYRNPGLFADDCPHSKADLSRGRADSAFLRMRQPIGWDPEGDYLNWLLTLDPKDKDTRLRMWRKEIRRVAMDRFPAAGRLETWKQALRGARATPPASLEDVEMALVESDLMRVLGDQEGSVKLLKDLVEASKDKYFGESLTRETEARLKLEEQLSGPAALEWRRFLAGWRKVIPDSDESGPWLTTYLRVRNERGGKLEGDELARLIDAPVDEKVSKSFHFEWYKLLANRLMAQGRFKDAARAFDKAGTVGPSGAREVYAEHGRRATYYEGRGPLRTTASAATRASKKPAL